MPYAEYRLSARIYDTCPSCGGTKTKGSVGCKNCRAAKGQKAWGACLGCGKRIRAAYQRCSECYEKARAAVQPLCIDCGRPTKQYASEYFAQRCWECEVKRRRAEAGAKRRPCSAVGCEALAVANGLCRKHYNAAHRSKRISSHQGGPFSRLLSRLPCQLCGYERLRSHIHRIVPGGLYSPPNIVALCSRCHDEVHHGITETPTPLSGDEIVSALALH